MAIVEVPEVKDVEPVGISFVYPSTEADRNNLWRILKGMQLESLYLVGWALQTVKRSYLDFWFDKSISREFAQIVR
jgi:hypothetical protein